jgi:hypothetical protein
MINVTKTENSKYNNLRKDRVLLVDKSENNRNFLFRSNSPTNGEMTVYKYEELNEYL